MMTDGDSCRVFFAGAGPGEIGLVTLKTSALLQRADVVLYEPTLSPEIFSLMGGPAHLLEIGSGELPAHLVVETLARFAEEGKIAVRLTKGDPAFFSNCYREAEALGQLGIPYEIVPGVTAATATPIDGGIPITYPGRSNSVHIFGEEEHLDYSAIANSQGTVLVFSELPPEELCGELIAVGMPPDTPAALLEDDIRVGRGKVSASLEKLPALAAKAELQGPFLLVLGDVCLTAEQFDWYAARPLYGTRVLVARPEQSDKLVGALREQGASVVDFPCITFETIGIASEVIENIADYGWVVMTSANCATIFFDQLFAAGKDTRDLAGVKLAAIGPETTAAMLRNGIRADLIPETYDSQGLAKALINHVLPGERMLVLTSTKGVPDLVKTLAQAGVPLDNQGVYQAVFRGAAPKGLKRRVTAGEMDLIAFTSVSTVEGFVAAMGELDCTGQPCICIGGYTQEAAKKLGFRAIRAKAATVDAMVQAAIDWKSDR